MLGEKYVLIPLPCRADASPHLPWRTLPILPLLCLDYPDIRTSITLIFYYIRLIYLAFQFDTFSPMCYDSTSLISSAGCIMMYIIPSLFPKASRNVRRTSTGERKSMTHLSVPRTIACFASLIMVLTTSLGWARDGASLTGIQVSQDLKRITITSDGQVGEHKAFVMQSPNRLVMDLEGTTLGSAPTRLKVDRGPITEIRAGHKDSRTRIVVDFGSRPVPPYKVHRQGGAIVLALDHRAALAPKTPAAAAPQLAPGVDRPRPLHVKTEVKKPESTPKPAESASRPTDLSDLVVKSSGVKEDLVFVELADRRDPKRIYHLVVDLDKAGSRVRNVTLSDVRGNLRRFGADAKQTADKGKEVEAVQSAGPRKGNAATVQDSPAPRKFEWGLDAMRSKKSEPGLVASRSPFRNTED